MDRDKPAAESGRLTVPAFVNDPVGRVTKENTVGYAYDAADQLTTNAATTRAMTPPAS